MQTDSPPPPDKKVLICGSVKHRARINEAIQSLHDLQLVPLFPDGKTVSPNLEEAERKAAMAQEHYAAMREADAVYFVVPGGYLGTSTTLELDYAAALGKPIFFSEKTNDAALDHYPLAFIAVENLAELAQRLAGPSLVGKPLV